MRDLVQLTSQRLLAALILSTVCGAWPAAAVPPVRLGDAVVPRAQTLHLRLDPAAAGYSGSTRIDLEVRRATKAFAFHTLPALSRATLLDTAGRSRDFTVERSGDLATARFAAPLAPGRYTLELDFTQTYETHAAGLYRVARRDESYLFTQFEQIEARRAFPCFDEPGFKLPWTLELEVPKDLLALANMSIAGETVADTWRTVRFKPTPPLPSYLVAFAVGPFDAVPIPGLSVPARVITVKGEGARAALAVETTPATLKALESYFGRPYPFDKLDLVAVPDFAFGAMENPGAITYAEAALLVDPRAVSLEDRRRLIHITAHELAHMWFGDFVTMRWWNDLWLNESFADWMAYKIAAGVAPELDFDIEHLESADRAMRADATATAMPLRLPDDCAVEDAFANVGYAYAKGVGVLSMVEAWVGEESFRTGLRAYLEQHAWGNADANDLWRALAAASKEDVVGVLTRFAQQPGVPRLDLTLDAKGGVTLRQARFHRAGESLAAASWRVPVLLSFADAEGTRTARTLVGDAPVHLNLAPRGALRWLLPNAGAGGYYRWSLEAPELARLNAASAELSRVERVAMVKNLRALFEAGTLDGAAWIHSLATLARDREPVVAVATIEAVAALEDPFAAAGDNYLRFVRRLYSSAANRTAWTPEEAESGAAQTLRAELLSIGGFDGRSSDVRSAAGQVALRWLGGNGAAVDPSLLDLALTMAAQSGDRELFESYRRRLDEPTSPQEREALLAGLASFGTPNLAAAGLDLALTDAVRSSEIPRLLFAATREEAGRDRTFAWVREHWAALSAKMSPWALGGMPRLGGGCSRARLDAAQAFFADKRSSLVDTSLARTTDAVEACLRLRAEQGAAVMGAMQEEIGR